MKEFVRTVLGDTDPLNLGWCQCHEHIFIEKCRSAEVAPSLLTEDYEKSLTELKDYKKAGGCSLVDAQPAYSGRMARYLRDASKASGINIVASTGFHKTIFYYENCPIFELNEQKLTDFFIDETEIGMAGDALNGYKRTEIKAGIIKTAVDSGGIYADSAYIKLFEAAAQAAKRTGAPVMTHIEKGADALEVVKFFEDRGIDSNRLILCHLDRANPDYSYNTECAQTGAFLEYDTINRLKYHDDKFEAKLIIHMLEHGFEDSILMSLDTTNERLRSYNGGGMGLDFILTTFAPYLESLGVNDKTIKQIMSANPARALKFHK